MFDRRRFIQSSVATGIAVHAANQQVQAAETQPIKVGVMGMSRGMSLATDLQGFDGVDVKYVCDVDTNRIIMRQHTTELSHFVRLYCSRIEALFADGGQLINFLDYDGVRSVKSLLAYHWKILVNLKYEMILFGGVMILHNNVAIIASEWGLVRDLILHLSHY